MSVIHQLKNIFIVTLLGDRYCPAMSNTDVRIVIPDSIAQGKEENTGQTNIQIRTLKCVLL